MKRFLASFIAVVMLVTLIPAGVLTASAAAGDTISMTYTELKNLGNTLNERPAEWIWPSNWSIDTAKSAGVRLHTDYSSILSGMYFWDGQQYGYARTQIRFDINISESQAGAYIPSIKTTIHKNVTFSAFHIYNGTATYLGDLTTTTSSTTIGEASGALNAADMQVGQNTIVFVRRKSDADTKQGQEVGFNEVKLTKIESLPTVSTVDTTVPATLEIGDKENLTAMVMMSDGRAYNFNEKTMNASDGSEGTADTANRLEITSSNPASVKVNSTSKGGVGSSTIYNYELEVVGAGGANITFTPYINGVAQTPVVKTVKVSSSDAEGNITLTHTQLKDLGNTLGVKPTVFPLYWSIDTAKSAGVKLQDESIRTGMYFWDAQQYGYTRTQIRFNINIDADQTGAYIPSVKTVILSGVTLSVFHIYNGTATYLGDLKTTTSGMTGKEAAGALNAANFQAGENTLVFVRRNTAEDTKQGYDMGFTEIKLTKLASLPTVSTVNTTTPETMAIGATENLTATVMMSDGRAYNFNEKAMLAADGGEGASDTANALEVTSSAPSVVKVNSTAKGGAGNSTTYNYELEAVGAGSATITFTPVINGVRQADKAVTKTVKVSSSDAEGNITLSYAELKDLGNANNAKPTVFPSYWSIDTAKSASDIRIHSDYSAILAGLYFWDNQPYGYTRTQIRFDINIDEDQAGAYIPTIRTDVLSGITLSVFHIYDGTATYLGDLVTGSEVKGALNVADFKEGKNTLVFVRRNTAEDTKDGYAFGFKEIKLTKVAAIPTVSTVNTETPISIAYGQKKNLTATVVMSDDRNYNFNEKAMNAADGSEGAADTANRLEVTSSNPSAVKVNSTSKGGAGNSTTYNYELEAVGGGVAQITFTPYINGVAQTATVKQVVAIYPNESVNYNPNFIVDAIVGNEGSSAEARALITSDDIAIGSVASAALGEIVTLKAESNDTYKFLYWYNGNSKKILSDEEEYSFNVGTKGTIYAKYARADGELKEHATSAGQIVNSLSDATVTETKKIGSYYTLVYEKAAAAAANALVEKTATLADFVCWVKDNKVVSYNDTYKYYPWTGNEVVAESTEGEKSTVPAVVLFENGKSYMLELVNFEGKTIVEKGILFAGSGEPTVNSFGAKAVAITDKAQFTASSDDATVARAYVIYKDGEIYRVAYSD